MKQSLRDAMRQQLAQLGNGAHAFAIQILGNADDAADAVQDALTTVLTNPGAYDSRKGALKPWFMRVVRNRCLDMLRRRRVSSMPVEELPDLTAGPEESAIDAQQSDAIRRGLAAIASEKREIIVLRDYLDMSYAEIADVLNIAPGTVMSRLHRARLALKETLENDGR